MSADEIEAQSRTARRGGRKAIRINLAELERLCGLQASDVEIASFFKISIRTLERRKKQPKFLNAMQRGRSNGALTVRRMLFSLAAKGNVAAAIFLSKNILGYRDVVNTEHTGLAGGPIQVENKTDLTQLSDEELRQLRGIAEKAHANPRD